MWNHRAAPGTEARGLALAQCCVKGFTLSRGPARALNSWLHYRGTGPPAPTLAPMSNLILETRKLTKEFKGFTAVDSVDLQVQGGLIHALFGPNGAGKTTCFNLLTKFLIPTRGQILFNGHDITGEKPHIMKATMEISDRKWNQYLRVRFQTVSTRSKATSPMPYLRASISTMMNSVR